jgi:hypothetical protein
MRTGEDLGARRAWRRGWTLIEVARQGGGRGGLGGRVLGRGGGEKRGSSGEL